MRRHGLLGGHAKVEHDGGVQVARKFVELTISLPTLSDVVKQKKVGGPGVKLSQGRPVGSKSEPTAAPKKRKLKAKLNTAKVVRRGRPLGSKNKPKPEAAPETLSVVVAEPTPAAPAAEVAEVAAEVAAPQAEPVLV